MTDVALPDAPSDAPAQHEQEEQRDNNQELSNNTSASIAQDRDPSAAAKTNSKEDSKSSKTADLALDGDSEAETLIESPEKKRITLLNVPRLEPVQLQGLGESPIKIETNGTDERVRTRKRKREDDEAQARKQSPSSSRRSSPLSSPALHEGSHASDSDASVRRSARKVETVRTRKRDPSKEPEEPNMRPSTGMKNRRRRPSDILPVSNKHRLRQQHQSIDNGSLVERRETRSATYPHPSSQDRSSSPEPVSRREHRRVASTQILSLSLEKKRRAQPPPINTRRNRSIDQRSETSDSSESPPPSRPRLHQFASNDHDPSSPAKAMGPRKYRDKNGRTHLARAASAQNLENAKACIQERPEDLDVPDNAGNTPLQIAALEGYTDIVRLLLENGCDVNIKNIDKDTPLIDAVENGHVEVVRLLLEHGADPRLANARGQEPVELVEDKRDRESLEVKKLLRDAKNREAKRRHSDDHQENSSSRAASAASLRDSPPAFGPRSPQNQSSAAMRRRTNRSEATRTGLLWEASTPENMTRLAGTGDKQGVANILSILDRAPPEAVIAAAKAGYDEVLQILQAMGNPDADPEPSRGVNLKPGYNTPMLAAIGRGSVKIIQLLLAYRDSDNRRLDPTRKLYGKTYLEVSEERKGHDFQNEYNVLKTAYDQATESKGRKQQSPRKPRDSEKARNRNIQDSSSPVAVKQRPQTESPAMSHKSLPDPRTLRHEQKRTVSGPSEISDKQQATNANGDKSVVPSSEQASAAPARKVQKPRRSHGDLPPFLGMEGEDAPKRRRLVTGKERRRESIAAIDRSSDDEMDSVKAIKTERTERSALKRSRNEVALEPSGEAGVNTSPRSMAKKRRTVADADVHDEVKRTVSKKSTPRASSRDSAQIIEVRSTSKRKDKDKQTKALDEVVEVFKRHNRQRSAQSNSPGIEKDDKEAPEDTRSQQDVYEPQSLTAVDSALSEGQENTAQASDPLSQSVSIESEIEKQARLAQEAEATAKAEKEAASKAEEEALIAAERRAAEATAAEEKRKADEAEARQRAEQDALNRQKEEEERQERLRREMEERRQRLEEQRRQEFIELERRRREALPPALAETARLIDEGDPLVQTKEWSYKFRQLWYVRTSQLDASYDPGAQDEWWVPNFLVAGLLCTKDLKLTHFTSFEKRPVSHEQRMAIWRVTRQSLSFDFVTSIFNCPPQLQLKLEHESKAKYMAMEDLFWVKVITVSVFCMPNNANWRSQYTDVEEQIARQPHLKGLQIVKVNFLIRHSTHPTHPVPPAHINAGSVQREAPMVNGIHHGPS